MCDLSRLVENPLISPVAAAILSGDDVRPRGVAHSSDDVPRCPTCCVDARVHCLQFDVMRVSSCPGRRSVLARLSSSQG